MALSDKARVSILGRAVRTQCRAFIEYIAESAQPYDLGDHPPVAQALRDIVAEKRAMADRLVGLAEALGLHIDLTVAFEPRFTFFNYLTTSYALKVLAVEGARQSAAVDALAQEAEGDASVAPLLADMARLEQDHLARVQELSTSLAPPPPPAAAPASTATT